MAQKQKLNNTSKTTAPGRNPPANKKNIQQSEKKKNSQIEKHSPKETEHIEPEEEASAEEQNNQENGSSEEEGEEEEEESWDISSTVDNEEAMANEQEENTEESDSDDEAPEAVSTKTAKEDALSATKRAREIHLQTLADTKQRRREADLKLKKQHEEKIARQQKKQQRVAKKQKKKEEAEEKEQDNSSSAKVPQLLSLDILAQLAEQEKSSTGKHVRLDEDSSEEEEEEEKLSSKQKKDRQQDDKSRTVGSFRVVALNDLTQAAPPIATSILSFRESHFYGQRVKRMDPILNISQRSSGAALHFARQEDNSTKAKRRGMGIAEMNSAPAKKEENSPDINPVIQ